MMELWLGRYVILIDDEDYERVIGEKWCATKTTPARFVARIRTPEGWVKMNLERFVLSPNESLRVERRTGFANNDFRKEALMAVSMQESQASKPKRKGRYTSKYKGVSRTKSGRWAAHICVNGRSIYIGTYEYEHEAALAYNLTALELFGEMAFQN
jgi:hypothetical protein